MSGRSPSFVGTLTLHAMQGHKKNIHLLFGEEFTTSYKRQKSRRDDTDDARISN